MKSLCIAAVALCLVAGLSLALMEIRVDPGYVASGPLRQDPSCSQLAEMACNDCCFDKQWAMPTIMASQAWQVTSGDASVVIAVLDTGIDRQHEDLTGKVIAEVNLTDSPTAGDIYGHGTHIAGIIAAEANNGLGIAGVAHNCRLMNVKVADDSGRCRSSVVARGIIWAVEHDARVINASLFITAPSFGLEQAIDYAWSNGVVVVAAAGNYVATRPAYPAYFPNCLAVAATDGTGSVVSWSGHGDWVDVAAPGVNIYSTLPVNEYGYKSGTSMAAAYVSGLAGLLFTVARDDSGNGFVNDEVRTAIESSCDEIGINGVGKGRINAYEALTEL